MREAEELQVSGEPLSRRRLLVLGGAGAVWVAGARRIGHGSTMPRSEPAVLSSSNGRLHTELVAAPGVQLAGRATRALGYNGTSPGPTLRVRPGDELQLRLTNHLDAPTNLHTHGLRVSPEGNSDNPFVKVDPGSSFDYRIRIPADHPAGTFWYHPHHHTTTADQIFGGLAGALLVEAAHDPRVDHDRVLVITDTTLNDDGTVAEAGGMDRMMGRRGRLVLVNGLTRPTLTAAVGTVERWRIVNACASRILPLRLTGPGLMQIALDGMYLPQPRLVASLLLAPGNRADVLISAESPGQFELSADPYHDMDRKDTDSGKADPPISLAALTVNGTALRKPRLPATLPATFDPTGPVTGTRKVTLAMSMGDAGGLAGLGLGGMDMQWTIDGRQFDPARDDQTVRAGAIEEWTVVNDSPMAHPFHLHVWGFTVVADESGNLASGTPQDVVLVPAHGWVRIRVAFTRFSGRSVYHCHVADHSDDGMMATVKVAARG